jgi:hypothetical protein
MDANKRLAAQSIGTIVQIGKIPKPANVFLLSMNLVAVA